MSKIKVGGIYKDQLGYRVKIIHYDNESVYTPRFIGIYLDFNPDTYWVNVYSENGMTDFTDNRNWDLVVEEV